MTVTEQEAAAMASAKDVVVEIRGTAELIAVIGALGALWRLVMEERKGDEGVPKLAVTLMVLEERIAAAAPELWAGLRGSDSRIGH